MKRTFVYAIFITVMLTVLSGCFRKELLVENTRVNVSLKVDNDIPILGVVDPGPLYRGVVWDMEKGGQRSSSFVSPTGGIVEIPAGPAGLTLHTFGCETTILKDEEDYTKVWATTNEADAITLQLWHSVLTSGLVFTVDVARLEGVTVNWEPDRMWGVAATADVPLRGEDDSFSMEMEARPLFEVHRVVLENVKGIEYLAAAEMFVTGVAAGRRFVDYKPIGECAIRVPLYRLDEKTLVAQYYSFGDAPDGLKRLFVMLTDTAGRRFLSIFDMAGAYDEDPQADITTNIVIEVPPEVEGGGLDPTIQDWNNIVTPVDI